MYEAIFTSFDNWTVLGDRFDHPVSVFVAGEEAMKNLEAAQVQMEQKLKIMTGFIDKELEKENEREVR